MIRLIFVVALLLGTIFVGYLLTQIDGRVIIELSGAIIQASLLGSFIVLLIALGVLWVFFWLFKKSYRVATGSRNWLGSFSNRQRNQAFYQSINAMLLNEPEQARKLIAKTTRGDFQGSNFLIAAELAHQAGDAQQAKAYLLQAMEYPSASPIALMKQAEMHLLNNQANDAMKVLDNIDGKVQKTKSFIVLKLQILEALDDWDQIKSLAKEHKKLLGETYQQWAKQWTIVEFSAIASKQGANALKAHWQQLSRAERKDQTNQLAYIQLLIDQGQSVEAEKELVSVASKQHCDGYWLLFKQLNHPNPSLAINFTEKEIKKDPGNPALYSVLANLAYNIQDYELANKAINKALELDNNVTDKALLAAVLEKKKDFEQANKLYKGLLK